MISDYSSVGTVGSTPPPPKPGQGKSSGLSDFFDELSVEFGDNDAGVPARDVSEREQSQDADRDRAERPSDDADHDAAAERDAQERDLERAAQERADQERADDKRAEDEAARDEAESAPQAADEPTTETMVDAASVNGAAQDPTANTEADGDAGTIAGQSNTAQNNTDGGNGPSPTTAGNSDSDSPTTASNQAPGSAPQSQQSTSGPEQTAHEGVDQAADAAAPAAQGDAAPTAQDTLLTALQEILGSDDLELLNAIRASSPDQLPAVLTMLNSNAGANGSSDGLAQTLMQRIGTLQERLDRLQQVVNSQQGNGANLDPSTASKLGLADANKFNDIVATVMKQTEQRLDALMNGNARAAAASAATGGTSVDGGYSSQANADAASGVGQTQSKPSASAQATAAAQRAAPPQTAAGIQVAIQLTRAVQDGLDRINIRLNPAELGRVEVKLELGHDGRTMAVVTADRQETLDLLQRDARGLERALQEAGLKTDSNSLNFNLRQQNQDGNSLAQGGGGAGGTAANEGDELAEVDQPTVDPDRLLDISV